PPQIYALSLHDALPISAWMAHSHGTNDAQKTMGIITLALFTGTKAGSFDHLPGWLDFLKTPVFALPVWVTILCAGTMAVGTAAGDRKSTRLNSSHVSIS